MRWVVSSRLRDSIYGQAFAPAHPLDQLREDVSKAKDEIAFDAKKDQANHCDDPKHREGTLTRDFDQPGAYRERNHHHGGKLQYRHEADGWVVVEQFFVLEINESHLA